MLMPFRFIARLVAALLALALSAAAVAQAPIERLGVAGPIRFGGEDFALAWTSNPEPGFYKQEYVTAGERPQRYTRMFMVDVRVGAPTPLMRAMTATLEAAKQRDPVVQYEALVPVEGEGGLLDFVMTGQDASGGLIVEWNAYRYVPLAGGRTAILGISRRAYGIDDAKRFLGERLRGYRDADVRELASMRVPDIAPRE